MKTHVPDRASRLWLSLVAIAVVLIMIGQAVLAADTTSISGQVFIATKGGQTVALGDVLVRVYPREQFGEIEKELIPRLNRGKVYSRNKMDALTKEGRISEAQQHGLWAMQRLFEEWSRIPVAPFSAKTDAAGRFVIHHKIEGAFVLVAVAKREIATVPELFLWRVTSSEINDPSRVLLSNSNSEKL